MPTRPSPAQLPPISDPGELESLCARLAAEPRIAFDTEAASFHRYVDRVYLIQVSSDHETALVDPLTLPDLSPLGALLAEPDLEVVFHDADYDLRILDRDYGFRANRLFDTRIAAQLGGEPAVGLGRLLEKYFGVQVDKKYQRADWSRRPLTDGMIAYAADDTRYLPALRDRLEGRLAELGRLEWAREEFRRLEAVRWTQAAADADDAFLRIKGAGALGRRQLTILRALYRWREAAAERLDRARFRVLSNTALLALAQAAPTSMRQLTSVDGMPTAVARRHGREILEAVKLGKSAPEKKLPSLRRGKRPKPDPGYDQRLERLKRLRKERAGTTELEAGLLCPNGTLQAIARAVPASAKALDAVEELRRWQRDVIGDRAILDAVAGG
jgi:ribonuclease D